MQNDFSLFLGLKAKANTHPCLRMEFTFLAKSDYEEMVALMNEYRENSPFTREQFEEFLEEQPSTIEIWVAKVDGKIVSTGKIMYEKKLIFNMATLAHIEDICTFKAHQRKGYGKALVQHLLQEAKRKGCYKVTLCCNEANSLFYKACGLEVRGLQMSQLV